MRASRQAAPSTEAQAPAPSGPPPAAELEKEHANVFYRERFVWDPIPALGRVSLPHGRIIEGHEPVVLGVSPL